MDENKRGRYLNLAILAAIFIAGTIYFVTGNGTDSTGFALNETTLTLKGLDDYSFDIVLADITSVTYGENFNYGVEVDGAQNEAYLCGTWHNDIIGDYRLCIYTNVSSYILIEASQNYYVFNIENDDTTFSFYESFLDYLVTYGINAAHDP